ncbi:AraC family transcriptional regulator [Paenibacillus woosongensis]|uniref:AraC family transcriptional regulator n=1 Tax=Paenibacillus woosongensis TaxID=307580 RepID=A0AA95KSW0_9BACL|nr:AraC family transcriptional regulator [Paenibacillus woosongensis]WHX48143.1 AraC family transcriptional regulator [Paenibacillus woosongensis]GIP60686.1 AraC family transcriptional regulator [Paenibacillus woosongensis]
MKPSSISIQRDQINLPLQFPLHVSKTEGVSPLFQRLHWHRALEINWITRGSGIYVINGQEYPFSAGDIFLINSDDLHRAYEGKDLEMVILMMEPALLATEQRYDPEILLPFRDTGSHFSNHISRELPGSKRLAGYIETIYTEFAAQKPSHASIIRGLLLQLLGEVNRSFRLQDIIPGGAIGAGEATSLNTSVKTSRSASGRRQLEQMRAVILALEGDVSHPWTLKEMAEIAHLSPSRFSVLFNQVVGTSPLHYLLQLRLDHAVELLEQGERSVLEIAGQCGFRNLSNFNRLFMNYLGVTPTAMRRRLQGEEVPKSSAGDPKQ